MKATKILNLSWENMRRRRFRTVLTTLGVVIGITAVIGLASLGEGFRIDIKNQLQTGFELNQITIIPGSLFAGYNSEGFSDQQIQKITTIPGVNIATGVKQIGNVTLYNGNESTSAFVATAINYTEFIQLFQDRFNFESGTSPPQGSNDSIIIGYKVNHFNGNTDAIFAEAGDEVTLTMGVPRFPLGLVPENRTFTVAGTLAKEGTSGISNYDFWVFLPLQTVREIYNTNQSDLIFVQVADPQDSEHIADTIQEQLGRFKTTVLVPLSFIKQVDSILNLVQLFLLAVASISLLVAGIGIMNITMVSVMERTREIGILKAIGAKNRTVLAIFLAEAAITGIIGGAIGIAAGYGLSYALAFALSTMLTTQSSSILQTPDKPRPLVIAPVFSAEWTLAAFIFAVVISIAFGLYPARKAARLDPVEALHYE